jgi:orotate phosphoribosyltransferase
MIKDLENSDSRITDNQKEFVSFLVHNRVLLFGEFVTKSGRHSPFFLNFGQICEGEAVKRLGILYARWIIELFGRRRFVIFGPAYKGIPLAVATVVGLAELGYEARYLFNRKEKKAHGDGGLYVGKLPESGETVVLVDDVVTAGTTLREMLPAVMQLCAQATFGGVVVGVDRNERGESLSARAEAEQAFGTRVMPLVSMRQIVDYLSNSNSSGKVLSNSERDGCLQYLLEYGAD